MANTKLEYVYRDANNYHKNAEIVMAGELMQEQIEKIKARLGDEVTSDPVFIPSQVGLKDLQHEMVAAARGQGEAPEDVSLSSDDTPWHWLEEIKKTTDRPTVTMSAAELYQRFEAVGGKWDLIGAMEKLGIDLV